MTGRKTPSYLLTLSPGVTGRKTPSYLLTLSPGDLRCGNPGQLVRADRVGAIRSQLLARDILPGHLRGGQPRAGDAPAGDAPLGARARRVSAAARALPGSADIRHSPSAGTLRGKVRLAVFSCKCGGGVGWGLSGRRRFPEVGIPQAFKIKPHAPLLLELSAKVSL